MALLNYSETYDKIKSYLTTTNTADKLKICISADKHFITHGVDLLASYASGIRGLVPDFTGVQGVDNNNIYFGANGWQKLIATTEDIDSNSTSTVPSVAQMKQFMSKELSAVDVMRFKGTVVFGTGENTNKIYVNGSIDPLTTCEAGDTYRIASNGEFNGVDVEPGDLLICIKDYDGENTPNVSDNDYWQIVLTNISGQAKLTLNGGTFYYYSPNINDKPTIFAPTTSGALNQVLVSIGTAEPTWTGLDNLISGSAKKLVETNGTTLISVGGISNPVYFKNGLPVLCEIIEEAKKVSNALSVGTGLFTNPANPANTSFDGSAAVTINLAAATNSTLGGVYVPEKFNDNSEEYTNLVKLDNGKLTVSQNDIIASVGGTIESYSIVLAENNTNKNDINSTTPQANPFINLLKKVGDTTTVKSNIQFVGSGKISVTGNNSKQITISLGEATSESYGGIKLGYSENNKNYAVKLNDGKAYVTVPHVTTSTVLCSSGSGTSDTTSNLTDGQVYLNVLHNGAISKSYKFSGSNISITSNGSNEIIFTPLVVTQSAAGAVPVLPKSANTINAISDQSKEWILTTDEGAAPIWKKLPANAFNNTWRAIKVNNTNWLSSGTNTNTLNIVSGGKTTLTNDNNGTLTISSTWREIRVAGESIGDKILDIKPNSDIWISKDDATTDGVYEVGFGLMWYNIDTNKYEPLVE